jgi:hypothetical protein
MIRSFEQRHSLGGIARPCLGGDNDASQTTQQTDRRSTAGQGGASVGGDGNTVMVSSTDFDAVKQGAELGRAGIAAATSAATSAAASAAEARAAFSAALNKTTSFSQSVVDASLKNTRATFSESIQAIDKAYTTAKAGDQRIVSMVALAVVGLAAIYTVGKR